MIQKTLVLIKPDGVRRNLVGEIIRRYEEGGLKIAALKMMGADRSVVSNHYPENDDYMINLGTKSAQAGDQIDNLKEHGRMIVHGLRDYLTSGPVVGIILEGEDAIAKTRKITGYTDPTKADEGTIRKDLGIDSILEANRQKRPVQNLIHASGNPEEAEKEISLWFGEV